MRKRKHAVSEMTFGTEHQNEDWGCSFIEVSASSGPKIRLCHVNVNELKAIATALTKSVLDSSWIMSMDEGASRSYRYTAAETAQSLVEVFSQVADPDDSLSSEFGELMVSMGASKALEVIFEHAALPTAELWKPQRKQNEGFDFHTVCKSDFINFGEAKYKSPPASSPASNAANQANGFFQHEKHYRDRVHLVNLVSEACISNLDSGSFGMVVAFSMNAQNPLIVYKNISTTIQSLPVYESLEAVYVVGVNHGNS